MMQIDKKKWGYILVPFLIICLSSCEQESHSPSTEVPEIFFENLEFKKGNRTDVIPPLDSLILTFKFRDREMDLGLNDNEVDSPYHSLNFFYKSGEILKTTSSWNYPNLIKIGDHDSLPPYSCHNYRINYNLIENDPEKKIDTFYVQPNPGSYNLMIRFFYKVDGKFVEWGSENDPLPKSASGCVEIFHGRFPYMGHLKANQGLSNADSPFRIYRLDQYESMMTYTMVSMGFSPRFKGKPLKLKFQILDRNLNKSNWVETPEIILE